MIAAALLLVLCAAHFASASNDACGNVNKDRCVEAAFQDLRIDNERPTSTKQLQQFDDPRAALGRPGRWTKAGGGEFLRENSNIRPEEPAPNCPPRRSFGTNLLLLRARSVLSTKRDAWLFRTTVSTTDRNGWFGVVFGFKSSTEHFRFAMRAEDSCASVQKRKGTSSDPWNTLIDGTAGLQTPITLGTVYEISVRYSDKRVNVTVVENVSRRSVLSIRASPSSSDLRAWQHFDIGLFSSANGDGVLFRNWLLTDLGAEDILPATTPSVPTPPPGQFSYFE